VLDGGGLQNSVEIELRSSHLGSVGREGVVPRLSALLSQPAIDGLSRQRRDRHPGPFGLCSETKVRLSR
jgi:hypothetical protein